MNQEDERLLKGCLKGKRNAQNQLYNKYERRMYAVAMRYADDSDEALDIMQEGFIRIFNNLHQFRGEGRLHKWMDRVMANAALRFISKKKKVRFQEDQELELLLPPRNDTEIQINTKELMDIIKLLPQGYRTVFNMYAVEGFSHKEIAGMLGITEGTSRSQYLRAKKAIQKLLEEYQITQ